MKYLWLSDLHLDRYDLAKKDNFIKKLNSEKADGIFISGDLAEGDELIENLDYFFKNIYTNIFFVLGNHEFYFSNRQDIFLKIKELCGKYKHIYWLTQELYFALSDKVCLIGEDSWYDDYYGNNNVKSFFWDWAAIKDFHSFSSLLHGKQVFKTWAQRAANSLEKKLLKTLNHFDTVFFVTHFPPYEECAPSAPKYSPEQREFWAGFDISGIVGQVIDKIIQQHPTKKIIVLCGHVHYKNTYVRNNNIEVRTAKNGLKIQDRFVF